MASNPAEVFLSYSRNDLPAANRLRDALAQAGINVFKDDTSLHSGDRWLTRLQQAVSDCATFVVLVGHDGVRRWVGAEVEVALNRHLSPHDERSRLPIFPILLGNTAPDSLPPFLALFQATRWDGEAALPDDLIDALRALRPRFDAGPAFEGCPFLGLSAFTRQDTCLFFGRRRETLEALSGLGDQLESDPDRLSSCGGSSYKRWLQIEGNSGSGKSSLVQAGMLPMVEHGAQWARTGFDTWTVLGPMMPGHQPVEKLAEVLEYGLVDDPAQRNTLRRLHRLEEEERALAFALREQGQPASGRRAFLLIVDQFEELFTFVEDAPRKAFDALLARALQDPECPLFMVSTVRADFLDRYEQLPRLGGIYNSLCKRYFLPSISEQGLREIIEGPAQLAGLDVSEVLAAIIEDARDEMAGALPLVENALRGLWDTRRDGRLCGDDYRSRGGLAGMLASQADALLSAIEAEKGMAGRGRRGALELLLRLTRINDGGRHTRQRISRHDALLAAGNGKAEVGERILRRLSGERAEGALAGSGHGGLRLIVTTTDVAPQRRTLLADSAEPSGYVDLIHETLIRARAKDDKTGKSVGYWPTLYDYIDANRNRDLHRQQLGIETQRWWDSRWFGRWWNLAVFGDWVHYRRLHVDHKSLEGRFVKWSGVALVGQTVVIAFLLSVIAESVWWADANNLPPSYILRKPLWWLGLPAPLPQMVDIPAGSFTMGCKPGRDDVEGATCEEGKFGETTLDEGFALGKYEVTFLQYDYYVWDQKRKGRGEALNYPPDAGWGRENRPVINVNWGDAQTYLAWLTERETRSDGRVYRLPTEKEWEYAARGGEADTPFGWKGMRFDATKANCGVTERVEKTLAVNRQNGWANGFGLHDMIGNVWEWTADRGAERGQFRVLRGGAWYYDPSFCRAASRVEYRPNFRNFDVGFRVFRGSAVSP